MTIPVLLVLLLGLAIACGLATVIKRNRAVAECVFLRTRIEALEKRLARHECVECGRETSHETGCPAALAAGVGFAHTTKEENP